MLSFATYSLGKYGSQKMRIRRHSIHLTETIATANFHIVQQTVLKYK